MDLESNPIDLVSNNFKQNLGDLEAKSHSIILKNPINIRDSAFMTDIGGNA